MPFPWYASCIDVLAVRCVQPAGEEQCLRHRALHGRIGTGDGMRIEARKPTEGQQCPPVGQEEYLKALFDAVHTGILVIDPATHRIMDANPAAARMIGLPRDEIVGTVCHQFV